MARWQLITVSFVFGSAAWAHPPEGGKIWGTLAPMVTRTKTSHDAVLSAPYVGAGAVVEADVDDNGGVEVGLFYQNKVYVRERGAEVLVERIKRMYVTTGYRHWFAPWVSAAVAVASSYSMGDPQVIAGRVRDTFRTTARDITEYGIDVSLQWEIWGEGDVAVVADARYAHSLSRNQGEDADVYGFLLGYKHRVPNRKR